MHARSSMKIIALCKKMEARLLCILLLCTIAICRGEDGEKEKFYIAGLFPSDIADPQDRTRLGVYPELAARLAAQQVNEGGMLSAHNISLELLSFGTGSGCDQEAAVYAYLQLTTQIASMAPQEGLSPPYVVLGPACDQPAYFTAALTSRYLKDIQISYSATTPLLSDVERFPLSYRTVPSYSDYAQTVFAIMRHFDWLLVGVVHQVVSHFTRSLEELNSFLRQSTQSNATLSGRDGNMEGAEVILSLGLSSYLSRSADLNSNARIFIAMVPEDLAAETICTAYKTNMIGPDFQWILLGDYQQDWWKFPEKNVSHISGQGQGSGEEEEGGRSRCSNEEMLAATESILILTFHLQPSLPEKLDLTSLDSKTRFWYEFAAVVNETTREPFRPELATRIEPTYDAVWAIAHALDTVLGDNSTSSASEGPGMGGDSDDSDGGLVVDTSEDSLLGRGFLFRGRPITQFTKKLNAAFQKTDFDGLESRVRFNPSTHSRANPRTYVLQMQSGRMVPIGLHDRAGLDLTFYGNDLVWLGETPPRDRPLRQLRGVMLWVVGVMIAVAFFGVVFAVTVLIMNCVYRKHKVIKASSPYLNMVIILGCVMGFLSVFFMSMENLRPHFQIRLDAFPFFCNVRAWLLTLGFTLAFGALFAKTWRIYVIFRNPWKKKRPYKDHILLGMVAVFVLFDLLILVLWASVDPLQLATETQVDQDQFIQREYTYCVSQYTEGSNLSFFIWLGIVAIPKAILLVFGVFLVVQTSRIKARFFRDAKFTGIAIFGFVMACGVGVPIAFVTMFLFVDDLGYVAATTTILICSYLILFMVFVPKFVLLRRYKKTIPSAVLLGLNPSFRIRRKTRIRTSTATDSIPRAAYYAMLLREANISRGSSSVSSFSDPLDNGVPRRTLRVGERDREDSIGWESAFVEDEGPGAELEVQETRVTFSGFEYIASMVAVPRPPSTETVMTSLYDERSPSLYRQSCCAGPGVGVAGGVAMTVGGSASGKRYSVSSTGSSGSGSSGRYSPRSPAFSFSVSSRRSSSTVCDTIVEVEEEFGYLNEPPVSPSPLSTGSGNHSYASFSPSHSSAIAAVSSDTRLVAAKTSTLEGSRVHRQEDPEARRTLYVKSRSRSLTIIPSPIPE